MLHTAYFKNEALGESNNIDSVMYRRNYIIQEINLTRQCKKDNDKSILKLHVSSSHSDKTNRKSIKNQ